MKKLIIPFSPIIKIYLENNVIYGFTLKDIDVYDITNKINKPITQVVKKDIKFSFWEEIFEHITKWESINGEEWEGEETILHKEYSFGLINDLIKVNIDYEILPVKKMTKKKLEILHDTYNVRGDR
jgi:hypothetical protein